MSRTSEEGVVFDDAPLCLCCEDALCMDGLRDRHLGPVCIDCHNRLQMAARRLEVQSSGYSHCEALGPDSGKGVRP